MKKLLFALFRALLNVVYLPLKLLPRGKKVVFLSRQGDKPGVDFIMIRDKINEKYPEYKTVLLCRAVPKGAKETILYGFHMLVQMVHLATSRVAVLDSYCIAQAVLRHKPGLQVVQLWHALGALKKFGWSAVGLPEGSPREVAEAMCMHRGYTVAVCSGPRCVQPFAEAFRMASFRVKPIGLPRVDLLSQPDSVSRIKKSVLKAYPALKNGKSTILYAPTFRHKGGRDYDLDDAVKVVKNAVDLGRFNLIIKTHSGRERVLTAEKRVKGNRFSGMELLTASDYVISDYSSIIFEAAILGKPLYLFAYDAEEYVNTRGFYVDYYKDIPAIISPDISKLMDAIAEDKRPVDEDIRRFADDFVANRDGHVTDRLAALVIWLAGQTGEVYEIKDCDFM